jgi:translation elongation factor EF-Ts
MNSHVDIRIVSHGERVTQLVRSAIADVAHKNNLKVTIVETPFAEYIHVEKKSLVVIAYDIADEKATANSEIAALIKALEIADMEAPDVQLAFLEDAVDSDAMDEWLEKLASYTKRLPFDPVKQPDILISAVKQERVYYPAPLD